MHPAAAADGRGQFLDEQARAAPDVEHPLAGPERERLAHDAALLHDVGRQVDGLDAA